MLYFPYFNKVIYKGKGIINYFLICDYIIVKNTY